MILIDTSGLLAALFRDQNHHEECARALQEAEPPLILSPFVVAELDYLILKYAGVKAEIDFIDEIARGAYEVESFTRSEYGDMMCMLEDYADLRIGIADASLIALAERHQTNDVLTLDVRHFRAMRPITMPNFRILPFDPPETKKARSRTRRITRRLT